MLDLASSSNENEGTSTSFNDPVSDNASSCTGLCCTGGVINQPTDIALLNKTPGRAQDPCTNGTWLSKLTE